jgi:hypothetical protein
MFGDQGVAYVGPGAGFVNALVQKWGSVYTKVEDLFDDGLTYPNHCMSLYIQQDSRAWAAMENLFRRTKLQGKTKKTIWKKEEYFRKGFWKIVKDNPQLAKIEGENDHTDNTDWDEQFRVDSSLASWWLNYYFSEHDPEMCHEVPLYTINDKCAEIIRNAKKLEKRMRGNRTEPVLTLPTSETKLHVTSKDKCWLKFEWDGLSNAPYMMGKFAARQYSWDKDKPLLAKLKKMFPHASIKCMDTPSNLYGETNNWFYIYFHWEPEQFSWAQVRKAEKAIQKFMFPLLGKFRPSTEPQKYQVVTLNF